MKNLCYLLISVFAFFCIGCGDSDPNVISGFQGNPNPQPTGTATPNPDPVPDPVPVARLRVLNAVVNSQDLVVSVDGNGVGQLDQFQTTGYLELEPGQHRIVVDGSTEIISGQTTEIDVLVDQTVTLAEDSSSTFVVGTPDIGTPTQSIEEPGENNILLTDDVTPSTGTLSARFLNILTPALDVSLETENDDVLFGLTSSGEVTAYSNINLTLLQGTDELRTYPQTRNFFTSFMNVEGSPGADIVQALTEQLGLQGANLTILTVSAPGDTARFLVLILDDLVNDDTIIVSQGTTEL